MTFVERNIREDERQRIADWIRAEYRADGLDDGSDLAMQSLADRIERGEHEPHTPRNPKENLPRLTKPQLDLLENADECTPPNERAVRFDWSGVAIKGARLRTAAALCKLGLLEFMDYGREEEADNGDPEVPIYAITAKGRAALALLSGRRRPSSVSTKKEHTQ